MLHIFRTPCPKNTSGGLLLLFKGYFLETLTLRLKKLLRLRLHKKIR